MTDEIEAGADIVCQTLERAAEQVGDIVAPVYAGYFARDPEAAALMAHMDNLTLGRMLTEVLRLLMSGDYRSEGGYLDFEVKNHQYAYRVQAPMYRALLMSVRDVVAEALGPSWDDHCATAWERRIGRLLGEIERRTVGA